MTNAELIEKLKKLPLEADVLIREESGFALLTVSPKRECIDGYESVVIG